MLNLKNRLVKNKDIQNIQKRGAFFREEGWQLKALKNGLKETRFCIVAGLGFSKKATRRNRIKRLTRVYLNQNINKINPGWDMVITAKKSKPDKQTDKYLMINLHEIFKKNHFFK